MSPTDLLSLPMTQIHISDHEMSCPKNKYDNCVYQNTHLELIISFILFIVNIHHIPQPVFTQYQYLENQNLS